MVRRFFQALHREIRGLHEAAYLLGFFALLSQILALIRDRLFAANFGAGAVLDTYYAAFRIPDLIFVGIASVVSVYVLIPFLSERAELSREAERRFIDSVFSAFFYAIIAASALAFILTPFIVQIAFPGLMRGGVNSDLVLLTRILLLQPILLGLSNLLGSITQTRRRFLLYAVSPLLYNFGIIAGVLFFYPFAGMLGLGLGVLLGALLHLSIQVPFVAEAGLLPRLTRRIDRDSVRRVVMLSLPRALALSANQFSLLIMAGIASVVAAGSIAVFQLAFNLQAVPLAIIGVSYSVAAFPTLAHLFTNGDREQFVSYITSAARHIIFWSLPVIALMVVLRAQVVRVILGAGAFGWAETRLTAAALAIFSISLVAQNLNLLFIRGYYAAGETRKPLTVNLASSALSIALSIALVLFFEYSFSFRSFMETLLRVEGLGGTAVLMLPLAYTLAFLVNAVALWLSFERDFSRFFSRVARTLWQSTAAALLIGVVSYVMLDVFDNVFNINTFWGILLQGLLSGIAGILAGLALLAALRSVELREAFTGLRHKFWKTEVLAPETEQLD